MYFFMKYIAILGFGVVGGGVYEVLRDHADVEIKYTAQPWYGGNPIVLHQCGSIYGTDSICHTAGCLV